MVKMNIVYEGDLRSKLTHEQSGAVIYTDAPKDNHGKGEAFSPTDLVAVGLGSCMLTVMGIAASRHAIDLKGAKVDVQKEMVTTPQRRIGSINVILNMPNSIPEDKRKMLEHTAHTCPVHKSLHPEVKVAVEFRYTL